MKFLQETAEEKLIFDTSQHIFLFYFLYNYNDDIMQHIRMKIVNMNYGMKKR